MTSSINAWRSDLAADRTISGGCAAQSEHVFQSESILVELSRAIPLWPLKYGDRAASPYYCDSEGPGGCSAEVVLVHPRPCPMGTAQQCHECPMASTTIEQDPSPTTDWPTRTLTSKTSLHVCRRSYQGSAQGRSGTLPTTVSL